VGPATAGGATGRPKDPIVTEIIRGSLIAATDEMKRNLMRTAYNQIIYEALDFTVGIFDRHGATVSIGIGLPMFIRGLSETVKAKVRHFEEIGVPIEPGDVLLTNDAYVTGSHLNHMVLTLPIFAGEDVLAFASTMAHWEDVGGVLGSITRDIYSEGLQMPIVKLFRRDVANDELMDIIRANVRFPARAMGDLRAQIAAIRTGGRRVEALIERHGRERFDAVVEELYDHSERISRAAVERIPDGRYEASSYMDDDGVSSEPIRIDIGVVVHGDRMTVDLSGVSPQVAGYFNSGRTAGLSAAQVAFKCLTTPQVFPINDGAFRNLEVILPPGRVVSASKPAAMKRWMTIPMTVVDTIFRALSEAMPTEVAAGHHADLVNRSMFGVDRRTGRFFSKTVGVLGGGWGAKANGDGMSATICINDGDTHNPPIEVTERKLPIIVEAYGLREDSGGPGRFRGGLGVEQRVRLRCDLKLNATIERTKCAPWGLAGGGDAAPNGLEIQRGQAVEASRGKVAGLDLAEGDVVIVRSGGGGGYGDPLERDPASLARDVREGYVSRAVAESVYGAVFGEGTGLDLEATAARRRELAGGGLGGDGPGGGPGDRS
jgi:N-methylhydantoinase B